jgi:hypothetical protein
MIPSGFLILGWAKRLGGQSIYCALTYIRVSRINQGLRYYSYSWEPRISYLNGSGPLRRQSKLLSRLVQYLGLRLIARVYFWCESKMLSFSVARVFSVDQIEHLCIPAWGSDVCVCVWFMFHRVWKFWCVFWTVDEKCDIWGLVLGSRSRGKDVILRELLRRQLMNFFLFVFNLSFSRRVGWDAV